MLAEQQRAPKGSYGTILDRERRVRHRAKVESLEVTPVVVIWGAAQHDLPAGYRAGDVAFIPARQLVAWLAALDTEAVARAAGRDLVERLEEYRARNWSTNYRA